LPPRGRALRVEQTSALDSGTRTGSIVSCGRALPGHDVRVVREDGGEAREREIGEITLAGPSVMLGYYRDDESTAEAIRNGRLHTGDLGYLSDGELFVCGRARDIIIVNGRKYHPHDLEWAIDDVTGVRRGRAVAFGASEPGNGDRVVMVVETNGAAPSETLAEIIRRRISEAFGLYVSEVVSVPGGTIGRTTSGKVQRAAIKMQYERGGFSDR
jgi:fatty-acyl-CoA synthase